VRLRGPLPLALIPLFVICLLIWLAVREDTYVDQGTSNWETHSSGRAALVVSVLINLAAVVAIFVVRGRGWAGWAISTVAILAGLVAGAVGVLAISAN
jgi:hypothetical protein